MTLDPALSETQNHFEFEAIDDHEFDPEAFYLMDFDGVLSSKFEDEIYRLEPKDDELELFAKVAAHFSLRVGQMEHRYQRHLLYQAAAWSIGLQIEVGPGFELARKAQDLGRLSILTARSGWYAVDRVRQFLRHHDMIALETFHVGRVPKCPQVELVFREFYPKTIVYVEDSLAHLNAMADHTSGLHLVYCEPREDIDSVAITDNVVEVFREALERSNGMF